MDCGKYKPTKDKLGIKEGRKGHATHFLSFGPPHISGMDKARYFKFGM